MLIDLTHLKANQRGTIIKIEGGHEALRRIRAIGIREGKNITKISSHFLSGPQVVRVGHARIAIGFGMAKKIIVEVEK